VTGDAPRADPGDPLRAALDAALRGLDGRAISAAVQRLSTGYRSGDPAQLPRLDREIDVTAYAAYRMPATYAAVRAVLAQLPPLRVRSLLDLGGGTGAAAWAVAAVVERLTDVTVIDRSPTALAFGARLAAAAAAPALRAAHWRQLPLDAPLPAAELITAAYLLGELAPADRADLVDVLAATDATVVLVEPGTPAGYRCILDARDRLLAAGHGVIAPCPHSGRCPLAGGNDWCHFAARLDRSAVHRRVKEADLGYEDEKFSYVVTSRGAAAAATGRVLRHPLRRKGLITLAVCGAGGDVAQTAVGRSRPAYRAAREVRWGDRWPPGDHR